MKKYYMLVSISLLFSVFDVHAQIGQEGKNTNCFLYKGIYNGVTCAKVRNCTDFKFSAGQPSW